MSPPDATLSSASAADPQDRQANHGWRMRIVEMAAERGVDLLDNLRRQSRDGSYEGDAAQAYSCIAKAIRQSVMLHAKFEEDFNKTDEQRQAEAAAAQAAEAQRAANIEAGRKAHQKRQVKRAVTLAMDLDFDAAEARGEQTADYADFQRELRERLDDYDEYSDFGRLPVGAVVENICRVLGIEFDPALWEDEPWAKAEMAEKPEGSPYADWQPSDPETANDDDGTDDSELDDPGEDGEDDPYGLAEEDDEPQRNGTGPPLR